MEAYEGHIWQLVCSKQLRKNIQDTKASNFICP
jgi:hypothetical protein